MKNLASISLFIIVFIIFNQAVFACTCVHSSVGKRFKKAEAVFIGKIPEVNETPENNSLIQGEKGQILKVIKSWKGIKKDFVSLKFNYKDINGACPSLLYFEKDIKYLVFAYGKELKVETECSDSIKIPEDKKNSYAHKQINKLNSFWFRFWTRINPF